MSRFGNDPIFGSGGLLSNAFDNVVDRFKSNPVGSIASLISPVGGAWLSSQSGQDQMNTALNPGDFGEDFDRRAQEAIEGERAWSAEQAEKQMDFQREMSSTQWQRAVEDMKKAGLNPYLAYQQGPNSTQSGAMGSTSGQQIYSSHDSLKALQMYLNFFEGLAGTAAKLI